MKMRQHFKSILLAQSFLLVSTIVFAFPAPSAVPVNDTTALAKKPLANAFLAEKLVSFNAEFVSRSVALHWNLAGQKVTGHFNVERSLDGEHFVKVGEVNANTNSPEYSFYDNIKAYLLKKNDLYYRLQQVDGDDNSYSKVLVVRMYMTHSVASISVTPDPTVNDIQVNVQLKESSYIVMKIKDSNGDEILKRGEKRAEGTNSFSLEGTNKLKPGNYTLDIIVNSNEKLTMELIKS
jgi:hypothetical protein